MPLTDPHAWQLVAFGDRNAFTDFLGAHALWHEALDHALAGLGNVIPSLPLGDGGGDPWHHAHQLVHDAETTALAIAASPDFTSYDLNDADQFASWTFLHALEHVRLRKAASL